MLQSQLWLSATAIIPLSDAEPSISLSGTSPGIAEARNATLKAMKEAEQGWQRAIDKIGERAGLIKRPDGMNNG